MGSKLSAGIFIVVFISIAGITYFMLSGLTSSNQVNEVIMKVSHSDHYEVSIIENDISAMNSHFGLYRATLVRVSKEKWIISVWAKKTEANNGYLLITLREKDVKVLASESVSEPYREVTISVYCD